MADFIFHIKNPKPLLSPRIGVNPTCRRLSSTIRLVDSGLVRYLNFPFVSIFSAYASQLTSRGWAGLLKAMRVIR